MIPARQKSGETEWQEAGFTLVELITAMAILAIVLTIAAFSFKDVLWRNQVSTAANDVVAALNLARSEAVTRRQNVTVCPSSNGTSCNTNQQFTGGWLVFQDDDGDGVIDASPANDSIIRVFAGPGGTVTVLDQGGTPYKVTYQPSGFVSTGDNATIRVANSSRTVDVVVSNTGRVRTQ